MLRSVADQPTLWEPILPEELRRLPVELARVDALLGDPVFFTPFVPFFDPRIGRPSTPMETYLRLMFLKFRYRLGLIDPNPRPLAAPHHDRPANRVGPVGDDHLVASGTRAHRRNPQRRVPDGRGRGDALPDTRRPIHGPRTAGVSW